MATGLGLNQICKGKHIRYMVYTMSLSGVFPMFRMFLVATRNIR